MRFVLLLSLMGLCSSVPAQTSITGEVVDATTGIPVPYANVYLQKHPVGVTAFRDGRFHLQLDSLYQDSLVVSCIGYKSVSFYLSAAAARKSLMVRLEEDRQELPEVAVKPREMAVLTTGIVPWRVPVLSLKTCNGIFDWHSVARHITNDHQVEGFIKNVFVFICKNEFYDAPFRLNLLQVDRESGKPSKPLVAQDFIMQASEGGGWVGLDLERDLIPFPSNGFFVKVQALPLDSIQMAQFRKRQPEMSDFEIKSSAPSVAFRSEKCSLTATRYWCHIDDSHPWGDTAYRPYHRLEVNLNSHCQSPRIKAEISYYADQKLKVKEPKAKRKLRKVVDVPKLDMIRYPQSSPVDLVQSLQKAIGADDFPYMFNHLIYYQSEEELIVVLPLVEQLQASADSSAEWEMQKKETLVFLGQLEDSLVDMKKSEDRFLYNLTMDGARYQFHLKEGLWKMGIGVEFAGKMKPSPSFKLEEAAN